jgi:hypothetical protein
VSINYGLIKHKISKSSRELKQSKRNDPVFGTNSIDNPNIHEISPNWFERTEISTNM